MLHRIRRKLLLSLVLLGLFVSFVQPMAVLTAPPDQQEELSADIEQALLDALTVDGTANLFVKMSVDADLSAAYSIKDWNARGEYVWNTLNEVACTTQAPVIEYAEKHGLDYHPMLTTNSVFIRGGNLQAAQNLATLPGVAYLRLERILQIPDPLVPDADAGLFAGVGGNSPQAITDWGITDTKADQVWALGVRGAGIKVANIDTGVQWDHPALVNQFACPGSPDSPACWEDPSNICGGSACDNNGHGTHTMGTVVAKDNPALTYIAGMAPDATWIACKGCETDACSEFALNTCADWILAPALNPANRPHVVNNSWGGGGCDNWYQAKVNAWRAAGIFPAFSAGNNGSGCNTLGSPGDYQESFGSAAHASSRAIAWFSSRGPSCYGHTPYTKPNISAPGVAICSTVPTDSWSCSYQGTSMASPHSAGAVALIWSADPSYVGQMDLTFELLQNSADSSPAGSCGAPPDGEGNYTYGYGYLNALAAVQMAGNAPPSTGTFAPNGGSGTVGQYTTLTTTYTDPDGYDDIAAAFFFLDRQPPIASGGLAALYIQSADLLVLLGGGSCQPGQPATTVNTPYVTLDCANTSVSPAGDTLTINWRVRPDQCFLGGCSWNYAVELVTDNGGLYDAGLVGWWQLNQLRGAARNARPGVKPTKADLQQLIEEIEAWR